MQVSSSSSVFKTNITHDPTALDKMARLLWGLLRGLGGLHGIYASSSFSASKAAERPHPTPTRLPHRGGVPIQIELFVYQVNKYHKRRW